MLAGTVLVGLSGYVFFAVIGHDRFDPATAAALAATYLLSNILGPGVFIAAEQESSRVISAARAGGGVDRTTVRRLAMICAGLGVLTLAVLGLCAPVLLSRVLDGDVGLVLALMLAVVGSAAVYYIRGLAGGQQRFHRYAATTGIDGGARIVGCLGLAVAGSTNSDRLRAGTLRRAGRCGLAHRSRRHAQHRGTGTDAIQWAGNARENGRTTIRHPDPRRRLPAGRVLRQPGDGEPGPGDRHGAVRYRSRRRPPGSPRRSC